VNTQEVIGWLKRLASLDISVFDEVKTNPAATIPGVLIAAVSILLSGLGGYLWWRLRDYGRGSDILVHSALIGSALAIALWFVWVGVVYLMLTQIFRGRAYLEQLVRVMGLGSAPIALMGLMFIPGVSMAIGIAALALTFGVTCVAISTVSTAEPGQVLAANLAGFLVWAGILTLLAQSDGSTNPHAPGIFLYNTAESILHQFTAPPGNL
jgi:hypothetical protein